MQAFSERVMVSKVDIIKIYLTNFDSTRGVPSWMSYVVLLFLAYIIIRVWLKLRNDKHHPLEQKGKRKKSTQEQLARENILAQLKGLGLDKWHGKFRR